MTDIRTQEYKSAS